MGVYDEGVAVQFLPSRVTYTNVLAPDVARIVKTSVQGKKIIDDLLYKKPDKQVRVVMRNCGKFDPENFQDSLRYGVYQGLVRVLSGMKPEDVIAEMKTSGLRGRGGAGFPTWLKWQITRAVQRTPKYIICNGDEGDPGAYMDRSVLEGDPHSVLEGLIIAAYAIGPPAAISTSAPSIRSPSSRVEKAIAEARGRRPARREHPRLRLLLRRQGPPRRRRVRLRRGDRADRLDRGQARQPEPAAALSLRARPVRPAHRDQQRRDAGQRARDPRAGRRVVRQARHRKSRGTKVFAVTGKVRNPSSSRCRSASPSARSSSTSAAASSAARPSRPCRPAALRRRDSRAPRYARQLREPAGARLDHGLRRHDRDGQDDSMVEVSRFYLRFCVDESCGKCAPCRIGGYQMLQILNRMARGRGKRATSSASAPSRRPCRRPRSAASGQTAPNPVLSALRYFEDPSSRPTSKAAPVTRAR
jgi:(2Fe-2S) ferredoxin